MYQANYLPPSAVLSAVRQCEHVFYAQITQRLLNLAKLNIPSPTIVVLQIEKQEIPRTVKTTNQISDLSHRSKRQAFAMGFVVASFVSNVWDTIKHKLWNDNETSQLKNEVQSIDLHLEKLTTETNITDRRLQAMNDYTLLQGKLLENHIHRTDNFISEIPVLAILIGDLISRLHIIGALIDRIFITSKNKRPDIDFIISLFQTDLLDNLDPANIDPHSIKFLVLNSASIQMEFVGRRHSRDTAAYKVTTFQFWGDLLQTPTLFKYIGPEFVVYNNSNSCVKGISEAISNHYVQVQCLTRNYEDSRLAQWEKVRQGDPITQPLPTNVKTSIPFSFVYCYGRSVEMNRVKTLCPPFVFKLNANQSWETDDYAYDPQVISIESQTIDPVIIDVHDVHFKNTSHMVDLTEALQELRNLRNRNQAVFKNTEIEKQKAEQEFESKKNKLINESRLFNSERLSVTYQQVTFLLVFVIAMYCVMRTCEQLKTIKNIKMNQLRSAAVNRDLLARQEIARYANTSRRHSTYSITSLV